MPTDNTDIVERERRARALATDLPSMGDELLVALYALNRGAVAQVHGMMPRAFARLVELELVDVSGFELDPVARALLELVARTRKVPRPYKTDSRSCFGLAWYLDELDAEVVGFDGRRHTINGGFDHGRACGRDSSFDCYAGAARLFAVVLP